jgi:hypothetical protein
LQLARTCPLCFKVPHELFTGSKPWSVYTAIPVNCCTVRYICQQCLAIPSELHLLWTQSAPRRTQTCTCLGDTKVQLELAAPLDKGWSYLPAHLQKERLCHVSGIFYLAYTRQEVLPPMTMSQQARVVEWHVANWNAGAALIFSLSILNIAQPIYNINKIQK